MRKIWGGLTCVFVLLLLFVSPVLAAGLDDIESGLEGIEDIAEGLDEEKRTIEEKQWDYIGEKWKETFLKNKVVAGVDNLFKKLNIVFVFLFGEDYDISFMLLFVIAFWLFFFLSFGNILATFSPWGKGVSYIMGGGLSVILAQFGIYRMLSDLSFKLIFYKEGFWGWIWLAVIVLVYIFLFILIKMFIKMGKQQKEEQAKAKEELNRGILDKFVKALTGGKK